MPSLLHNPPRPSLEEKRAQLSRLLTEDSIDPDLIPLSSAQERLWFLDKLEPNSPVYNVAFGIRLSGRLDVGILRSALQRIVGRHEALRTNFVSTNGTPSQSIRAEGELVLRQFDLSDHPGDLEEELERGLAREARLPFDLAEDLLIRATLFQLKPDERVLLLVLHHIVCDEWSLNVLFQELTQQLKQTLSAGKPSDLPELPIQYADFALWQRECLQGPALAKQRNYWKNRLAGESQRLNLPWDYPPDVAEGNAGGRVFVLLPQELSREVRDLSRREGATLFMTMLTGFKALLYRYSSQSEITVGSPIAGRSRLETENLIGFFVNTLVLRTPVSGDVTFRELLQRVRETTLGAYEHQDFPFDKLVEELHPERAANRIPFLQVTFALEQDVPELLQLPGLSLSWIEVDTGTAKFDLTWVVRERGANLEVWVEYKSALFKRETVERMLSHWQVLLQGIVANPEARLSELPLVTAAEREQALTGWNSQGAGPIDTRSLAELFESRAQVRPKALAVRYGERELTYAELNKQANLVAHTLRGLGVEPNALVALCAERSVDLVVGMLGIIKAGGAYLPLDPTFPKERLSLMLRDSQAKVIVTQTHLRSVLPLTEAKLVFVNALPAGSSENVLLKMRGEDPAYVIYTSGSTGRPKGVLVPQRAVVSLVCDTDYVQLTPEDRVAQASNCSFDAATFEIWGALLNGASLIGISRETLLAPKDLANTLARERITTLFVTTALFNQLAAEVPDAFQHLKHLLFGGEMVDVKWVRRVLAHKPPQRLLHVYGPTETTTFACWHHVVSLPPDARTLPIGRPIHRARAYVLDPGGAPVPVGVPGALYVGGAGVALGYLHQGTLTSERFLPDPFSSEPKARLYQTGDLARYRADGSIEFIGRVDNQVKIRGFRVELGEIEASLAAHPSVREAIVVARDEEGASTKKLVAYVVLKQPKAPDAIPQIRQWLRELLPSYMVPSNFVELASLPLNPNGKVDRRALPPPKPALGTDQEGAAPRTVLERELAALWGEILGLEKVRLQDNFFESGGHSLLAVRLFSEIERRFGKKLPLASLFRCPTLEQLVQLVQQRDASVSSPLITEIQPHGSKPPIFWMHSLGGDGGGAFFYYRKLAALLGEDQPSLGVHSPSEPFTCLEAMATHYIEELIRYQPNGPYFLGGFCFGGVLAYEVARQMRERGLEIGLLVLLESAPPHRPRHSLTRGTLETFARNLRYWVSDLVQQDPAELSSRIQKKSLHLVRKIQRRFAAEKNDSQSGLADLINLETYPEGYARYAQAHWQALCQYRPQPYSGRITLFRARKQPLFSLDPTLGWSDLARDGVAVNIVPGTHEKMLEEPNVRILATELKACLAEGQHLDVNVGGAAAVQPREPEPRRAGIAACPFTIIT